MKILTATVLVLAPLLASPKVSAATNDWTIGVDLYRIFPADDFKALTNLGSLIAKETSNGFLVKTVITRAGFHEGASFCILANEHLGDAAAEKARILAEIKDLRVLRQFDEFNVTSPSSCMNE